MTDAIKAGETFLIALAAVFVGLKLAGLLYWPWWLVLLPIWGPIAALLAVTALTVILPVVIGVLSRSTKR